MTTFLLYAIKSAFVLSILFVPYMLMLRNEKFFRFNRLTLLAILLLSVCLPLCNCQFLSLDNQPVVQAAQQQMIDVGIPIQQSYYLQSASETEDATSVSWFQVISIIYIIGMAVVLTVRLVQFCRMGMVIRGGSLWKESRGGINIYCHADDVAPFSWLNNIVISRSDYEASGREIILHEQGHILCRHSLDIIFLTTVQMLQWWNPLVYILGISLRDVHEYEADDYVLRQGITLGGYQEILIKKAVGTSSYAFANNFNHSLTIKRITMMQKKQANPWRRSKVLYFVPMVAVALSAFATPEFIQPIEKAVDNLNEEIVMPEPVDTCQTELNPEDYTIFIDGRVSTPAELESLDKSTIDHADIIDDMAKVQNEFGSQITKPVIDIHTKMEQNAVKNDSTGLRIVYTSDNVSDSVVIILDGKKVESVDGIDQTTIDNITVLKEKTAKEIYLEWQKSDPSAFRKDVSEINGIIEIRTKQYQKELDAENAVAERTKAKAAEKARKETERKAVNTKDDVVEPNRNIDGLIGDEPKGITIVDGNVVESISDIDPEDVDNVTVITSASSIKTIFEHMRKENPASLKDINVDDVKRIVEIQTKQINYVNNHVKSAKNKPGLHILYEKKGDLTLVSIDDKK
ncbi:MAG: M56 family metallopeptidase [Bacteroidaceae bacterium]|nr:M56 family metallopeptidase [Bacteroidaceae bacterium]